MENKLFMLKNLLIGGSKACKMPVTSRCIQECYYIVLDCSKCKLGSILRCDLEALQTVLCIPDKSARAQCVKPLGLFHCSFQFFIHNPKDFAWEKYPQSIGSVILRVRIVWWFGFNIFFYKQEVVNDIHFSCIWNIILPSMAVEMLLPQLSQSGIVFHALHLEPLHPLIFHYSEQAGDVKVCEGLMLRSCGKNWDLVQ